MKVMISTFILSGFLFGAGTGLRISRDLPEFPMDEESNMERFGGLPDFYGEEDLGDGQDKTAKVHPFGNELAQLANRLYAADQCGKCGSTTAAVMNDKRGLIPLIMGTFTVDIGKQDDATCAAKPYSLADRADKCKDMGRHLGENNQARYIGDTFPHLDEVKRLFNTHLSPHLKDQAALAALRVELADTLVVHLRGTDVMHPPIKAYNAIYLPAPCKYVTSEIERVNLKKVMLITNDASHACLDYIKKNVASHFDVSYEARSEKADIMTLMSASNLVLSTASTYGLGALLLNPGQHKTVSMPVWTHSPKSCDGQGHHGCDSQFFASRLTEMCKIAKDVHYYEIPEPTKVFPSRAEFITDDANFAGTVIHKCN